MQERLAVLSLHGLRLLPQVWEFNSGRLEDEPLCGTRCEYVPVRSIVGIHAFDGPAKGFALQA